MSRGRTARPTVSAIGGDQLDVEIPHCNLYDEPLTVLVRLKKKVTLPADDTWLVSSKGKLFQLRPGKPSRGTVMCYATPRPRR